MPEQVRIIYHCEDGHWWAVSPDMPDLIVAGDSRAEVRQLVDEGVADEGVEVIHLDTGKEVDFEAPASGRFLADLGRVAGPLLIVHGFKFEHLTQSEPGEDALVLSSGHDLTYR